MLASLTHARLRAAQGDTAGARALLRELLRVSPGNDEARQMLAALDGAGEACHDEPLDEPVEAPRPSDVMQLRGAFRAALGRASSASPAVERLERWAAAIARNRGGRRHAR